MLELLKFILSSGSNFLGFLFILIVICITVYNIVNSITKVFKK